ncbi:hypothetical protein [Mycoplasma hafezii]|uniref:hypothetical protein n=1 Tax=Mycoplasma hafezii TaxID=525886 RepID=UPI003CEA2CFB
MKYKWILSAGIISLSTAPISCVNLFTEKNNFEKTITYEIERFSYFNNTQITLNESPFLSNYANVINLDYISQHYASSIKTAADLDKIMVFLDKSYYEKYHLVAFEYLDEQGILILYFKDDMYSKIPFFGYLNFIIKGFKKKDREFHSLKTSNQNLTSKNSVGFYYTSNNKTILGNGMFLNYLKPTNHSYPNKWFLFTVGHLFWDQFDNKPFEINIFNTQKNVKALAKVIQDGRDTFNNDLSKIKNLLPNNLQNEEILSYLDYAILEINFNSEYEAEQVTSDNINDTAFKTILFNENLGYFDYQNNRSQFIYYDGRNHFNEKYFNSPTIIGSVSNYYSKTKVPFFDEYKVFKLQDRNYIDLSPTFIFKNTNFDSGSSGLISSNHNNNFIKIANSNNKGLWLPFNFEFKNLSDQLTAQYNLGDSDEWYEYFKQFSYDIYFERPNINQNKCFIKTIRELYPNRTLGFNYNKK